MKKFKVSEFIAWIIASGLTWSLAQQVTVIIPGSIWLPSAAIVWGGIVIGIVGYVLYIRSGGIGTAVVTRLCTLGLIVGLLFGWYGALGKAEPSAIVPIIHAPQTGLRLANSLICGGLGAAASWALISLLGKFSNKPFIPTVILFGALIMVTVAILLIASP